MACRAHRLSLDRLESRELMTGDVTAFVLSNTLYITEAAAQVGQPNAVQISQLSNGAVRVAGRTNSGGTLTHVNGDTYRDFFLPNGSLDIRLGAGNDYVGLVNTRLNYVNIDLSYPNTADADSIYVNGLATMGSVQLRTGGGADRVTVLNSTIGDGIGSDDLNINSGAGSDYVQVGSVGGAFVQVRGNLNLTTFALPTEIAADTVNVYETFVGQALSVTTAAGNDTVNMGDDSAGWYVVLDTGGGNDKATLDEVSANQQFWVYMGYGDDTLDMTYLRASALTVNGGPGYDRLFKYLDGPTGSTSLIGWEQINGHPVWHPFGDAAGTVGGALAMP